VNVDEIFFGGTRCLTGKSPFDFGADADQDPDPGMLTEFFITAIVRILRISCLRECLNVPIS